MQRGDGIFGALTVRQSSSADSSSSTYDEDHSEHMMLMHDWLDMPVVDKFMSHHHSNGNNRPESVLINGKGKRREFIDPATNKSVFTDREVYSVQQGVRYRFRSVSGAVTNCGLKVSIDDHNLTIIASDGQPLEPFVTEILIIYGGERFDFVINANQSVGNYWIRANGIADCVEVRSTGTSAGLQRREQDGSSSDSLHAYKW